MLLPAIGFPLDNIRLQLSTFILQNAHKSAPCDNIGSIYKPVWKAVVKRIVTFVYQGRENCCFKIDSIELHYKEPGK